MRAQPLPRAHCVYVMDCDHAVKVGISFDPEDRRRELERASGLHVVCFRSWRVASAEYARWIEAWAHRDLQQWRTVGEWFHCHPIEAADIVDKHVRMGHVGYPIDGLDPDKVREFIERVLS